jgi:NADH-quinone oxidoreductase subunit A
MGTQNMQGMISDFGIILLFFILGVLFVGIALAAAALIRPNRPNPVKTSTYECGEIPIGEPWIRFNVRFYVIALVFLLFDVEVVFLFPWAVVFKQLGWFAYIEMIVFVAILLAGFVYVWMKGDLDWEKPKPYIPKLEDLVIGKKK